MKAFARWAAAPLAVYGLTRLIIAAMVLVASRAQVVVLESIPGYHSTVPSRQPPGYLDVMTSWDGQWYWDVVLNGYPDSSLGPDGQPAQTSLAFFPLFPMLARGVGALTGWEFRIAGPTLSLALGALAVLAVYRLLEEQVGSRRALLAIAVLCTFASAPVLQAGYTESLALLLVAVTLILLRQQRYLLAIAPMLLLGVTRNITLPLVPVILLHWFVRVREHGPERDRRAAVDRGGSRIRRAVVCHWRIALLAVSALGAAAIWPAMATALTGEPDAYLSTMSAWPGFTGSPLKSPWVVTFVNRGAMGVVLLLSLALLFALILSLPSTRGWGPELWGWAAFYPIYIVAASGATYSILRYLLLAFPLALIWVPEEVDQGLRRRDVFLLAMVLCVGVAAQWFWISKLLVYSGPEGGWGFP